MVLVVFVMYFCLLIVGCSIRGFGVFGVVFICGVVLFSLFVCFV